MTLASSQPVAATLAPEEWPNLEAVVTEDDTPVDNIFAEKQQRLLVEPLYSSWPGPGDGRPFLALANVGLFYAVRQPPLPRRLHPRRLHGRASRRRRHDDATSVGTLKLEPR